jgi:hypothetical protein
MIVLIVTIIFFKLIIQMLLCITTIIYLIFDFIIELARLLDQDTQI